MRSHGIDISKFNTTFSYPANPPLPVDFVIQRLSYVGATTKVLIKDERIAQLTPPVLTSPCLKGAYHYVASFMDWKKQADFFISLMNGRYDFWAWDIEKNFNTNVPEYVNGIVPALEYIYHVTKKPGLLYINPDTWGTWLKPVQDDIVNILNRTDIKIGLWVAHYWYIPNPEGTPNYFEHGGGNMPRNWKFWQYDADQKVNVGKAYGVGSTFLDLNVFNGTKEELIKWVNPTKGEFMNILDVKYVSQLIDGALTHNNDCGSASSLMELNTYGLAKGVTVDQFYDSIVPSGDYALNVDDMQSKMLSYGLKTDWFVNTSMEDVYGYLKSHRPILALVHYGTLVDAGVTEKIGFRGGHFLVITGIDLDNVYINDPYRTDGQTGVMVPISVFEKCWKDCSIDGNPVGGCLVPKLPIQDLGVIAPPTTNDEYYLVVNGLNVRSGPSTSYPLIRTIWRSKQPIVHCIALSISGDYIQLSDLSGWVWFTYVIKS
jgi:GH25 family lysozyme M1 (1,4-beta-N-acetylmuramidase)